MKIFGFLSTSFARSIAWLVYLLPAFQENAVPPKCYEVGSSAGSFHESPEVHYRQIYFGALGPCYRGYSRTDLDQPGYRIYQNLEQLIVKASKGNSYNDELDEVCRFYGSDLSRDQLEVQLSLLQPLCEKLTKK